MKLVKDAFLKGGNNVVGVDLVEGSEMSGVSNRVMIHSFIAQ